MNRLISLVLVLALVSARGDAAIYYLDKDATGAATGTSWANAWTAGSQIGTTLLPGDVLYMSGGPSGGEKVYPGGWVIGRAGTASNPIVYKLDAANPAHNGKVVFDWAFLGDQASQNGFTQKGYFRWDGEVAGEQNIVFRNLANYLNKAVAIVLKGSGTHAVHVRYCRFEDVNGGMSLGTMTGLHVEHSYLRVRGDAAITAATTGTWDSNRVHDCTIEVLTNGTSPPGRSGYNGPDGIQATDGLSAYRNKFIVTPTTLYTSPQHPDMFQVNGRYLKAFNNEFIGIADSGISPSPWFVGQPIQDIAIFNNVFRRNVLSAGFPEFIRMYNNSGLPFFSNVKVVNNTFLDAVEGNAVFVKFSAEQGQGGTGNELKNNLFYNVGAANSTIIAIAAASGGVQSEWSRGGNIYWHPTPAHARLHMFGANVTADNWVSTNELTSKVAQPTLTSYTPYDITSDVRPAASDTVAQGGGLDLSHLFATLPELRFTANGSERPVGAPWDIGALSANTTPNNPPTAAILVPDGPLTITIGTSQTFTGIASDPEDGDLSSSIVWTSSRDGQLGIGGTIATSALSVGIHTISAKATDLGGASHSATRSIQVAPLNPAAPYSAPHRARTRHGLARSLLQ